jgi:hypothetical protein
MIGTDRHTDTCQVQELAIDYTDCANRSPETNADYDPKDPKVDPIDGGRVSSSFKSPMRTPPEWGHATEDFQWPSGKVQKTNTCILVFDIPNDVAPPILFYYRLTNFYQNHRRYVKSFDVNQLKGQAVSVASIRSGECDPLDIAPAANGKPERPYYPCGLIANSMFNDTFSNLRANNPSQNGQVSETYDFSNKSISWSTEGDLYGKSAYRPDEVVPPPNWQEQYPEDGYDSLGELPDLHTMEAFQVWMRTAGLPTFSKLAMRNDNDVLKSGTYVLKIHDRMLSSLSSWPGCR